MFPKRKVNEMIKSMTGFGKYNDIMNDREYQIEVKSVNHRYLDISVKLPRQLSYLEDIVKKEVSKNIKRGKIDIFITFNNNSQEGRELKIDKDLAKTYIKEIKDISREEDIVPTIDFVELLKLPDVLSLKYNQEDEQIKQEVISVLKVAIGQLINMRSEEGNKIFDDLMSRIDTIESKIIKISEKSTGLIQEYVVKLEGRVKEILQTEEIDKSRIAQEVVIYADKSSIEEEITRLKSHISQFRNLLQSNEAVGKKLDFIIQEMNRETNTIGSKSNCLEITNNVIDIKTELEDIREQIQNIE